VASSLALWEAGRFCQHSTTGVTWAGPNVPSSQWWVVPVLWQARGRHRRWRLHRDRDKRGQGYPDRV